MTVDRMSAPRSGMPLYDRRRGIHYEKPLLRGWMHLVAFEVALVVGTLLVVSSHGSGRRTVAAVYPAAIVRCERRRTTGVGGARGRLAASRPLDDISRDRGKRERRRSRSAARAVVGVGADSLVGGDRARGVHPAGAYVRSRVAAWIAATALRLGIDLVSVDSIFRGVPGLPVFGLASR